MKNNIYLFGCVFIIATAISCTNRELKHSEDHSHPHDQTKETFSIENLVDEVKTVPDSIIEYLHVQHHSHKVLERRTVPPGYESKELKNWSEYFAKVEDLPAINPGPGVPNKFYRQ